ncbi:MAG: hypothetical protein RI988_3325 [Pseudomonadota bacterium]|jgi:hypothetical protein
MKVRFYCDIPSHGVRVTGQYGWSLCATSTPASGSAMKDFTRVAFDVDMPPNLVLPPHDVMAPASAAVVLEGGEA